LLCTRATGMSKSGLYAHFGSKQELQLATVEEASRILAEEVVRPGLAAPPGRAQLVAACEAFLDRRIQGVVATVWLSVMSLSSSSRGVR
jgi:AcrR family transcriptional regulator